MANPDTGVPAHDYPDFYRRMREECLPHPVGTLRTNPTALKQPARSLRRLPGHNDQAARAVSSL